MAEPNMSEKPSLIRKDPLEGRSGAFAGFMRTLPAWIISAAIHAVLIVLFLLLLGDKISQAKPPEEDRAQMGQIEIPEPEPNLEQTEVGLDPDLEMAYDVKRKDDVNVPGPEAPDDAIGIVGVPEAPPVDIPPPPGTGIGQGGAPKLDLGKALQRDIAGGITSLRFAKQGGFAGRSGATRVELRDREGGNNETDAAVARGLLWLALHQAPDGHWSLDEFPKYHRQSLDKRAGYINVTGKLRGTASRKNDVAGTAFGLLPFLGGGFTHKKSSKYTETVLRGLLWMIEHQNRNGDYGGGMYAHGLATIAMCEAYALTSDPKVGRSAQLALNFIAYAQDPETGGWRYQPRRGADTSVVGWQLMALKSGQMAGLNVPTITLKNAERYLETVEKKMPNGKGSGQFGYTTDSPSYTMSAVGLLCRQYLGEPFRSPTLINGTKNLLKYPASSFAARNMYYIYYATQVMHHVGGDRWEKWNLGESGRAGMRETLLKLQDDSALAKGSWDPRGDAHGDAGGRIMKTSLCLLTLEVYYRHLPLYRRGEVNAGKKMSGEMKK